MFLIIKVNGESKRVDLGLLKEVRSNVAVLYVNEKEVEIEVDQETEESLKVMVDEHDYILIPVDLETRTIYIDAESEEG